MRILAAFGLGLVALIVWMFWDSSPQGAPYSSGGTSVLLTERLATAALEGNVRAIEAMLPSVDVNASDETGSTMLMLASFGGHENAVRLLCENDADPNRTDSNQRTALMYAATGSSTRTVEILLEHGADVNAIEGEEGWTALMFAAAEGQAEVVQALLDGGASPGLIDIDGESAASFASKAGHEALALTLTEASRP